MRPYTDSPKTIAFHAYMRRLSLRSLGVFAWCFLALLLLDLIAPALLHKDTIFPLGIHIANLFLFLLIGAPMLYQTIVFAIAITCMRCPECGRRSLMMRIQYPPLFQNRPTFLQCRRCRLRFQTDDMEQRITGSPLPKKSSLIPE